MLGGKPLTVIPCSNQHCGDFICILDYINRYLPDCWPHEEALVCRTLHVLAVLTYFPFVGGGGGGGGVFSFLYYMKMSPES